MKIMNRNKRPFWYLLYQGTELGKDAGGYETGEKNVKYAGPVKMEANISPAAGYAQIQQFGQFISYDKVIITDDMTCPIDENAVLFIDKKPEYKDGRPLYDYVVKQIAKSLNLVSIAVSKVNVS
jgi:hypothetical protein